MRVVFGFVELSRCERDLGRLTSSPCQYHVSSLLPSQMYNLLARFQITPTFVRIYLCITTSSKEVALTVSYLYSILLSMNNNDNCNLPVLFYDIPS